MYNTWAYINIAISMVGVIMWVVWSFRNKFRWRYSFAPLSILLHVIAFYIGVLAGLDNRTITIWSNGVRLHAVLFFTTLGVYLALEKSRKWKLNNLPPY